MQTKLKDKIAEILENYRDDVVTTNERGTIKDQKVILNQATLAILTAFKEALPKERTDAVPLQNCGTDCYNICLSDILKTIGGAE